MSQGIVFILPYAGEFPLDSIGGLGVGLVAGEESSSLLSIHETAVGNETSDDLAVLGNLNALAVFNFAEVFAEVAGDGGGTSLFHNV
jgi:hypothetical protein